MRLNNQQNTFKILFITYANNNRRTTFVRVLQMSSLYQGNMIRVSIAWILFRQNIFKVGITYLCRRLFSSAIRRRSIVTIFLRVFSGVVAVLKHIIGGFRFSLSRVNISRCRHFGLLHLRVSKCRDQRNRWACDGRLFRLRLVFML